MCCNTACADEERAGEASEGEGLDLVLAGMPVSFGDPEVLRSVVGVGSVAVAGFFGSTVGLGNVAAATGVLGVVFAVSVVLSLAAARVVDSEDSSSSSDSLVVALLVVVGVATLLLTGEDLSSD